MNYWHEKIVMPNMEREILRQGVKGEFIAELNPIGHESVNLLRVAYPIFLRSFMINRKYLYKGDYTAPPEENNYENCECFLTEDGLAGFAITHNNWLISVFSNEPWRGFLRLIFPFISRATKLVCIVNDASGNHDLVNAYKNILGFKVIANTIDDTDIMREYYGNEFIDNFLMSYGRPYHIFMYRPGKGNKPIGIRVFSDYFEAEAYVDKEVD